MTRSDTFLIILPFSLTATSFHGRGDKKEESSSQEKLYLSICFSLPEYRLLSLAASDLIGAKMGWW